MRYSAENDSMTLKVATLLPFYTILGHMHRPSPTAPAEKAGEHEAHWPSGGDSTLPCFCGGVGGGCNNGDGSVLSLPDLLAGIWRLIFCLTFLAIACINARMHAHMHACTHARTHARTNHNVHIFSCSSAPV